MQKAGFLTTRLILSGPTAVCLLSNRMMLCNIPPNVLRIIRPADGIIGIIVYAVPISYYQSSDFGDRSDGMECSFLLLGLLTKACSFDL